jgi:hypothetical protein
MQGYVYGRSGNPSRHVLEACLASLDGAKYGLCFASGLGATTAVVHLLNSGDHIVSVDDLYGGTYRYFNKVSICGSSLISQISAGILYGKAGTKLHSLFYFIPSLYCLALYCLQFYEEVLRGISVSWCEEIRF